MFKHLYIIKMHRLNYVLAIGVDIGGSHISNAAIEMDGLKIIPGTTFSVKLKNKAAEDQILENWSHAINRTKESAATG